MDKMARCDLCVFWKKSDRNRNGAHPDDMMGECRRNSPSPVSFGFHFEVIKHLSTLAWQVSDEKEREENFNDWEESHCTGFTTWPNTEGDDWCGEFRHSVP